MTINRSIKDTIPSTSLVPRINKDMKRNWTLYLLVLPVLIYYIVFHYGPMYGVIMAFKDFRPNLGILGSEWVGFENFIDFFSSIYAKRIILNTLNISFQSIIFGFPAPIIFALFLNEIKLRWYKKSVQTITLGGNFYERMYFFKT